MKIRSALLAALLTSVSPLFAQEPVKPQLRSAPPSPIALPQATPNEPLPLIPETPDTTEKPKGSAIANPKSDKTSAAEDELGARLRMREIRTQALQDAKIRSEWDRAHAAKTDLEKREAMKNYYTLLYAKMEKLDGSLHKRIAELKSVTVKRLTQHNIDPTDPIASADRDTRNRE